MEPITEKDPSEYTEDEKRWAIAASAKAELERLNPDYQFDCYDVADPEGTRRSLRFGDLPIEAQEGIRRGLEAEARGEIVKYDLEKHRPTASRDRS